jgi:hypothetical protein
MIIFLKKYVLQELIAKRNKMNQKYTKSYKLLMKVASKGSSVICISPFYGKYIVLIVKSPRIENKAIWQVLYN